MDWQENVSRRSVRLVTELLGSCVHLLPSSLVTCCFNCFGRSGVLERRWHCVTEKRRGLIVRGFLQAEGSVLPAEMHGN